jgi:hypothetical protein
MSNTDRKSILVSLRTAVDPRKYQSHIRSPIVVGEQRNRQYAEGVRHVVDLVGNLADMVLIDNTVAAKNEIPSEITSCLPDTCTVLACQRNRYGRHNKGAGDIEIYRHFSSVIERYEFVLHFEPRMRITSPNVLVDLLGSPRLSVWNAQTEAQLLTGYYMIPGKSLADFVRIRSPLIMSLRKQSIESLFFSYALDHGWRPRTDSGWCERFDAARQEWESY